MGITFDSNFIIDVIRSDRGAVTKARAIDAEGKAKFLTTPVLYEISSGLLFTRSRSEAAAFRAFASRITVLPFDEASALKAAEVRAELMRLGRAKSHIDVMIAGIAAGGGHTLVTKDGDLKDISQVIGLDLEGY